MWNISLHAGRGRRLRKHKEVWPVSWREQDSGSSSGFLTSPICYQKWDSAISLQWCGFRAPTSGHLHRCDCSSWEATEVLLTSSCLFPGVYYGGRLSGLCLHMVKHLLPPGYYLTAIFFPLTFLLGFVKPLHSLSPHLKAGLLRQWLLQLPQLCFMIMSTALCIMEIMTSLILIVMSLIGCSFVHSSNHTTSSRWTSDKRNCRAGHTNFQSLGWHVVTWVACWFSVTKLQRWSPSCLSTMP